MTLKSGEVFIGDLTKYTATGDTPAEREVLLSRYQSISVDGKSEPIRSFGGVLIPGENIAHIEFIYHNEYESLG